MRLDDYLLNKDDKDWPALLEPLGDLLPERMKLWLVNRLGDMVGIQEDGSVLFVDLGACQASVVADSRDAFLDQFADADKVGFYMAVHLVDACVQSGMTLNSDQCYGFQVPPIVGGAYSVDNMTPIGIAEYYEFIGSLHEQIRDVPDGTSIRLTIRDDETPPSGEDA